MEPFTLEWAAQSMGGQIAGGTSDPNALVTSVCVDSRQARPGALFFALQGDKSDGHAYVAQALRAGAVGAVVSHIVNTDANTTSANALTAGTTTADKTGDGSTSAGTLEEVEGAQIVVPAPLRALGDLARRYRRQFAIPIVGVTGSVGKTSTKEMIAQVLRTTYHTLASDKNYNNEIGVPLTLFGLDKTHQAAVVEMGMRGLGQIDYLAEIAEPIIGVITNIGSAHIELLGSQENIARAKAELFARLPVGGVAILPAFSSSLLYEQIPEGCHKITFAEEVSATGIDESVEGRIRFLPQRSLDEINDTPVDIRVTPKSLSFDENGAASFEVFIGSTPERWRINLQAVGSHHVPNALAALAVAYAVGIPMPQAIAALEAWQGAEGRMSVRHTPNNITVLDDCYNASPSSMIQALNTLLRIGGSTVAVLGDMKELGNEAQKAHHDIGWITAFQNMRMLIVVGELAAGIADGAVSRNNQVGRPSQIIRCPNAVQTALHINEWVKPGDTVLIKGSRAMGMEIIVDALMQRSGNAVDEEAHA